MKLLPTYISETYTLGGVPIQLVIYSYDPAQSAEEVKMIADSLTISTTSSGKSITHGLHAGQLHVSLYSERDRIFEELASSNDREVYCQLKRNGTVVWRGMLDGEQWHEPYSYRDGYATDLVFSDFGVLGRTRLSDACGERTVYTVKGFVQKCIDAIYPDNAGKLTVSTYTETHNKLASLGDMVAIDQRKLHEYEGAGALSLIRRELASALPSDGSVYTGSICDSIIDLSHWQSDKDRPEDEPDVESVLEDVLKALNLHLWQTTTGDYTLADHETLATAKQYALLDARGEDATIETTETYNRLTLSIDTDIDTDLDKPDMESIEGRDINLIDLHDKVTKVTACTFTHSGTLSKPKELPDSTPRCKNYAFATKSGSVSTNDRGVAVVCNPLTIPYDLGQGPEDFWSLTSGYPQVADFAPASTFTPIWTEEFHLPQVDITTASDYFIALSLEMLIDNGYNPYQRDPKFEAPRAAISNISSDDYAIERFRKRADRTQGVRQLLLEAEVTCGNYKLVNVWDSIYNPEGKSLGDTFAFQTKWVEKDKSSERLYIPYLDIKYGAWRKPTRNYYWRQFVAPKELPQLLTALPRATHNDTLTLPIPPVTNAPIRVALSGRFKQLSGRNKDGSVAITESSHNDSTKTAIAIVARLANLVSYFLLRNMKLELVRRDEKEEKGEELVLASTLNDKAFEHRKEELALSTEPALPSISKSLLRTLDERERGGLFAKLWTQATGQKLSPIVTLPPIRGKLTCGAFTGTLEELYIAEQYTHYAQRRNRISGSYAPTERIVVRHEGKQFLVTQSDWHVLSDITQLTMEEIKPVNYSAKYIERTK